MRQILAARLACLFAGLAVGVAGCGSASSPPQESPTATVSFTSSTAAPASPPVSSSSSAAATPTNAPTQAAVPPPAGSALAALATLSVRGPGPMSGYSPRGVRAGMGRREGKFVRYPRYLHDSASCA